MSTPNTLTPETDAERLLAEQLGKEGGIRPEFAEQLLEGIRTARESTNAAANAVALNAADTTDADSEQSKAGAQEESASAVQQKPAPAAPQKSIDRKDLGQQDRAFVTKLLHGEVSGGFGFKHLDKFVQDPKNGLYVPERGDIAPLTDEDFEKIILEKATHEDLEKIRRMERAMLMSSADLAWPIYLQMLNNNKKRDNQVNAHDGRASAFAEQDRILNLDPSNPKVTTRRPLVIESASRLSFMQGLVRNIIAKTPDNPIADEYALMQALAPDLIDLAGWTPLAEKSTRNMIGKDNLVSGGVSVVWSDVSGVRFRDYAPEGDCYGAVSRPVVMF